MRRLWRYAWKSSDGSRHEGTIDAETRDGAFAALRERGIRPIKVTQVLRLRDRLALLAPLNFVASIIVILKALSIRGGKIYVVSYATLKNPDDDDAPGRPAALRSSRPSSRFRRPSPRPLS